MSDKPKADGMLTESFTQYRKLILKNVPEGEIPRLEMAFMGGALTVFKSMIRASEILDEEQGARFLEDLEEELRHYVPGMGKAAGVTPVNTRAPKGDAS